MVNPPEEIHLTLTQKSTLIDRMAWRPFFISMCQFGDICIRVIKTLFKEQRAFLIFNNSTDNSVSFER